MQNQTTLQDGALLFLRLVIAAIFLVAAYYKLPFWYGAIPGVPAWLSAIMKLLAIVEPLGALALVAGFLTRWSAAGLAVIMLGAIPVTKFVMGMGFVTATGAGWNFPLMVLSGCLVLVAFGAGNWSLDSKRAAK